MADQAGEPSMPFLFRRRELQSLVSALRACQSRLITGADGAGKSRLIDEALSLADPPNVRIRFWPGALHSLLVALAEGLNLSGLGKKAASARLKVAILERLRQEPRCIIIERVRGAEPRTYRFLQEIYHLGGCSLVLAARSRAETGYLGRLLWDPREEIPLRPFSRHEARKVFDAAAERICLEAEISALLRERVVAASQGLPGQIVAMCRLARRPEYRSSGRILFAPLRIDALLSIPQ